MQSVHSHGYLKLDNVHVTMALKNQNNIILVIRDCPRPTKKPLQSALIQIQALNLNLGFGARLKYV